MIFENSGYLAQLVSSEVIMAFAKTFGGRLDCMTITDANLKSRSSKPDQGKIKQALAGDLPPLHILLFQRGKDGNNNFPECSLALMRLSQAEEEDAVFSLIAEDPAEDREELAADWWNLAAEAGAKAGNGYLLHRPVRDITYGIFASSMPAVSTPTWEDFDASCHRFILERSSFIPAREGKMLRNVLWQNSMTSSLAEMVKDKLRQAGMATDLKAIRKTGLSGCCRTPRCSVRPRVCQNSCLCCTSAWPGGWHGGFHRGREPGSDGAFSGAAGRLDR